MKLKLITIVMCSLLLAGCANEKIESHVTEGQIYKSDYDMKEGKEITFETFQKELKKNGVEIEKKDSDSETFFQEYYLQMDNMSVNMFTKVSPEKEEVLQSVQIRLEETHPKKTQLHENMFFKSLMNVIQEEQINTWVTDLEEQHGELKKKEVLSDDDEIADFITTGTTHVSFVGVPLYGDKELEIVWGNWEDIPQELSGVVAELENLALFMVDYTDGFKGKKVKIESGPYHLIESGKSNAKGENLGDSNNFVGYKVMHDPNAEHNYSSQLYFLIPEESKDDVKIEDLVGIDVISRVMDMSWDDFKDVTSSVNEQINKAKETPYLGNGEYSGDGETAGYRYEIQGQLYNGMCEFTVFIEKI